MRFLAGFLACLILLVAVGAVVVYGGVYNIAATESHGGLTNTLLHATMENAVRAQAATVDAPESFTEQQVAEGREHFRDTCVICHGAPGVEAGEIGKGLNPDPPALSHAAEEFTAAELFWIVKHGIRMTGMPAFGPTHDDETLWSIVAFVARLPGLTPDQYRAMSEEVEAPAAGGHQHGQSGG